MPPDNPGDEPQPLSQPDNGGGVIEVYQIKVPSWPGGVPVGGVVDLL